MQYLEQQADKLRAEYEQRLTRLRAEEERRGADIGLQMRERLEKLHETADRLHEDLRHSYKSVARRVRDLRDGLAGSLEELSELLKGHRLARPLRPGDEVYVIKMHKWGTVERVDREGRWARVRVGDAQVEVAVEDLQPWGQNL
jgi:dsDNA-specific endonuclease/ATPase MutS2